MDRVCKKCNVSKPQEKYRIRTKKRSGKVETWIMGECRDCEAAARVAYYYEDHERGKRQSRENQKKIRERDPKVGQRQWLKRKDDPKYKEWRKKYWKESEEQRIKHSKVARKYHEKNRDTLADNYVISHIRQYTTLTKEDVLKSPELIELKRLSIKLKRALKDETQTNPNPKRQAQ